jgi:hypothetical protein
MQKLQFSFLLKLAPVFAFVGYGSWATWVNFTAGADNYLASGCIQGSYAFVSTLGLKITTFFIFGAVKNSAYAKLITYTISLTLMVTIPVFLHLINGTQKIFYSILPGSIIGSFYLFIIVWYEIKNKSL